MLKDASAAGAPAPASLNGIIPGDEAWVERKRPPAERTVSDKSNEERSKRVEVEDELRVDTANTDRLEITTPAPTPLDSSPILSRSASHDTRDREKPSIVNNTAHRHRASTLAGSLNLNPSPAKPITAKDSTIVSSRGASSLQPSHSPSLAGTTINAGTALPLSDTSLPTTTNPAVSRLTVSSLLDQLTEIHDRQQAERKQEWDRWIRKKRKGAMIAGNGKGGEEGGGASASGVGLGIRIGINQMGLSKYPEEARALGRLVRGGVPLGYRPDVWAGEFA